MADEMNTTEAQGASFGDGRYTLSSYEPVTLVLPKIQVHSTEIRDELLDIARRHAVFEEVPERALEQGDIVAIDIVTTHEDGTEFAPLTQEHALLKIGNGDMPADFEEWLLKMNVGDEGELDYEIPVAPADPMAPVESAKVHSKVKLNGIRREVIPSITDAWVAENIPNCENVADLNNVAARTIANRKRDERISHMPSLLAAKLAERLVGEIDEAAIEEGAKNQRERLEASLASQKLAIEDILGLEDITAEEFDERLREEARATLAEGYALVALAEHLNITVDGDDIDRFINAPNEEERKRLRKEYEQAGLMRRVIEGARGMKAIEHLVRTAVFTREDGTVDERFHERLVRTYEAQRAKNE